MNRTLDSQCHNVDLSVSIYYQIIHEILRFFKQAIELVISVRISLGGEGLVYNTTKSP